MRHPEILITFPYSPVMRDFFKTAALASTMAYIMAQEAHAGNKQHSGVPCPPEGYSQTGDASWYQRGAGVGSTTASGAHFDDQSLTAAHNTLPLNSKLKVTNLDNHQSVEVVVKDRGPHSHHRIIDVTRSAAKKLKFVAEGTAAVRIDLVSCPRPRHTKKPGPTRTK